MRLIDNPTAQRCTTCSVDTAVLVEILREAAAFCHDNAITPGGTVRDRLAQEVESGERVTLRVEDWQEPPAARASKPVALPKSQGINPGWRERW